MIEKKGNRIKIKSDKGVPIPQELIAQSNKTMRFNMNNILRRASRNTPNTNHHEK